MTSKAGCIPGKSQHKGHEQNGAVTGRAWFLTLLMFAVFAQHAVPVPVEDDVRSEMLVSTEWLAAHLHDTDVAVLCIAENDSFYSSGHIPGARLIRLSDIVTTRAGIPNELPTLPQLQRVFQQVGIDNLSRIIIYGERSGMLAARGYFTLDYLGLADHAALLDGGIEKWRAERRTEATGSTAVARSKLQVRVHPEILVDRARIETYSGSRKATDPLLIDARFGVQRREALARSL